MISSLSRRWRWSFLVAVLMTPGAYAQDEPAPVVPYKVLISDKSKQLTIQGDSGERIGRVVSLSVPEGSPAIRGLRFEATPLEPTDPSWNAYPALEVTTEPETISLQPGAPPTQVLVWFPLRTPGRTRPSQAPAPEEQPVVKQEGATVEATPEPETARPPERTGLPKVGPAASEETTDVQPPAPLSSGEYRASLRAIVANPAAPDVPCVLAEIPMTVKVRHGVRWPLFVLASGVGLGLFFAWFKATGRDRDQAIMGRDGLLSITDSAGQPALLRDSLNSASAEIDAAINRADWAAALASVRNGEAIALRWRRNRADWESLDAAVQAFRSDLERYRQDSETMRTLNANLREELRTLSTSETPEPFRLRLKTWNDQLGLYRKTHLLIDDLNRLRRQARHDSEPRSEDEAFEAALDQLAPSNATGFADLKAKIKAEIDRLRGTMASAAVPPTGASAAVAHLETPPSKATAPPTPAPTGLAARFTRKSGGISALRKYRLKVMDWVGYVFPAGVFVVTGLSQLYLANPIFGSWADYFGLLIWGIGSDAGGTKLQELTRRPVASAPTGGATPDVPHGGSAGAAPGR